MKKTFTLIINEEDIPVLGDALSAMPFKSVVNLISSINQQLQAAHDAENEATANTVSKSVSE